MNERIRQLATSNGIYDCITDPYDKLRNGDDYSSVMIDLERFAELIIQEAGEAFWSEACHVSDLAYEEYYRNSKKVKRHFGIE